MEERARIAQELHDSVVQAIAGSTMLVESAAEKVPDSLPIVKGTLLRATDRLDFALTESRAALKGLRDTAQSETDLAKQLAAEAANAADPKISFTMSILGEARELRPMIRYEVFRIGSEAISNAFRHSCGSSVGLEVGYVNGLRVLVRDDGKGIPADILQHGKSAHFGLRGIRERADRIGAKLAVRSRLKEGTEVEITVPEGIAFETAPGTPSFLVRCVSRLRRRYV
jgi:signal transduction histidine kinase